MSDGDSQLTLCQTNEDENIPKTEHIDKPVIDRNVRACVKIKGEEKYGVIRWIGEMNHRLMAGLEMVGLSKRIFIKRTICFYCGRPHKR